MIYGNFHLSIEKKPYHKKLATPLGNDIPFLVVKLPSSSTVDLWYSCLIHYLFLYFKSLASYQPLRSVCTLLFTDSSLLESYFVFSKI